MEKLNQLLKSRKFWAAVVGLAVLVLQAYFPRFPFTEEQITSFVYLLMAYILGTGMENMREVRRR